MKLESKSIEELEKLKLEIENMIETKKKEKKAELLKDFEELAKKEGLSIDEIIGTKIKTKAIKIKTKPKYKNKDGQTWTGKGRKPAWIKEIIETGGNLEDWLIS